MKTLNKLIETIETDPQIIRFKQLEAVIDQNEDLQRQYKDLLNLQKIMVSREINNRSNYPEAKEAYDAALEKLMEHVLMSEYLDLLEAINEDINLLKTWIEDEINQDFD